MNLNKRIGEIEAALRGRELVYFGVRGADSEPLLRLSAFTAVFSMIAPLEARSVHEISLEAETCERVELDSYNIDRDRREIVGALRQRLLHLFDRPAAVLPYRPCGFLSSTWYPRSDRVLYLGMHDVAQAGFEHKPWVEKQLSTNGVQVLPWRYWADSEKPLIAEWAAKERLVLRTSYSDGGVGVKLIREPRDLEREWPDHSEGFLAAAPYLVPSTPLNINGCVFPDGIITLHGPSVQLVGIPRLTRRMFGYCGNDFASMADLEPHIVDEFECMSVRTGQWLHRHGYRGAFGIDALLHDGRLYLTEVNPRFQGSSLLSTRLDAELGEPDLYLNHMSAFLGLCAPSRRPLRDMVRDQRPLSHLVCHNVEGHSVHVVTELPESPGAYFRLHPSPRVAVPEDSTLYELVLSGRALGNEQHLQATIMGLLDTTRRHISPVQTSASSQRQR